MIKKQEREKADTWMPFFIGDYFADTVHLSRDQHGGYLLLLFAGWKRGGQLPDDDAQLAQIVKAPLTEWRKKLRPIYEPFYEIGGGLWVQKRLVRELADAAARNDKAKQKAKIAADARWHRAVDNHAQSNAQAMPQASFVDASSIAQALLEECPPPPPIYNVSGLSPVGDGSTEHQNRAKDRPEKQSSPKAERWWDTDSGIEAKAREVKVSIYGLDRAAAKDIVFKALEQRRRTA